MFATHGEVVTSVTQLTLKVPCRLLMFGDKLDNEVNHYVKADGVIATTITMASATAIVRRADRNLSGSVQYHHQLGKISSIPKGLREKKREYVSEDDCC